MNDKIYPSMVIRSQAEAIELLEKENKELREQKAELTNMVCNKVLASYEYSSPLKDSLNEANLKIIALEESKHLTELENTQLKSVIKEIREYIKEHLTDKGRFLMLNEWQVPDLLQILDKVNK